MDVRNHITVGLISITCHHHPEYIEKMDTTLYKIGPYICDTISMFETALFLPLKVFYDYRLFYFIWPIFMMYFMYKSIMLDSLFVYILDTCVYFFQHLLSLETHSVL